MTTVHSAASLEWLPHQRDAGNESFREYASKINVVQYTP
jgi:hypothetical protein